MKAWQAKIGSVLVLAIILATYTQCVPQQGQNKSKLKYTDNSSTSGTFNDTGTNGTGNSQTGGGTGTTTQGLSSVQAFSQTMHPITRARCINCHGSFQQPLHAVADATAAHDAIMNTGEVNFSNPAQSRMALKLTEGHNCWGGGNPNARGRVDAGSEWGYRLQAT